MKILNLLFLVASIFHFNCAPLQAADYTRVLNYAINFGRLSDDELISNLRKFRDRKSVSESEVEIFVALKERVVEALLQKIADDWQASLPYLIAKEQRQYPGKAYGAAFLAFYIVMFTVGRGAALISAKNAFKNAFDDTAEDAAEKAAWCAAGSAAGNAAATAAFQSAKEAAWGKAIRCARYDGIQSVLNRELKALSSKLDDELSGFMTYSLSELLALLWLTENWQSLFKEAFDAAYQEIPAMKVATVKAVIKLALHDHDLRTERHASMVPPRGGRLKGADRERGEAPEDLKENVFFQTLEKSLEVLDKLVLAK